ncbi:MAG: SH3 domain-containing protein [Candidatus Obscuribacterales bacterium]|nr:SH3 domain-containing protein [Candidatus Obscuribacterales bacterium]
MQFALANRISLRASGSRPLRLLTVLGLSLTGPVLYPPPVFAQIEAPTEFQTSYGEIKAGKLTYTVLPSTELKSAPKSSAAAVTKLPPGTPLTVVSKSEASQGVNGFLDSWYQVKTKDAKTGYIWGGNLSKAALSLGPTGLLLLTIEGTGTSKTEKQSRAILVRDGKLISEAKFSPIELPESHVFSYSVTALKFPTKGFNGNPTIARFAFDYGACDYPYGDILVGVTGDKVTHLMELREAGNETGGTGFDYILPTMKGGKPNSLIIDTTTENFEEKKKSKTRAVYTWSGSKFTKTK